jgi:hypothetical protein
MKCEVALITLLEAVFCLILSPVTICTQSYAIVCYGNDLYKFSLTLF